MNLKSEVKQEYEGLKRVMDYVNALPFVEGKFTKIKKCRDFYLEECEHPILICEGEAFFKIEDRKFPLELTMNYLGPSIYRNSEGIYLSVSNILQTLYNPPRQIYGGILEEFIRKQNDKNLVLSESFELGYHPLDGSNAGEQVDKFFSQAESIIGLINSSEVKEAVKNLEKTLSPDGIALGKGEIK